MKLEKTLPHMPAVRVWLVWISDGTCMHATPGFGLNNASFFNAGRKNTTTQQEDTTNQPLSM